MTSVSSSASSAASTSSSSSSSSLPIGSFDSASHSQSQMKPVEVEECDSTRLYQDWFLLLRMMSRAPRRSGFLALGFIQRYSLRCVLDDHQGCVNSVLWDSTGEEALSGSDDTCVKIWSFNKSFLRPAPSALGACKSDDHHNSSKDQFQGPLRMHLKASIRTEHRNNIFCASFQPYSGNSRIVSCAADGMLCLSDVEEGPVSVLCRGAGICFKHVHVPFCPDAVILSQQNGSLVLVDVRENSRASDTSTSEASGGLQLLHPKQWNRDEGAAESCRMRLGPNMPTALQFNPVRPFQLAVGDNTSDISLFDIRHLPISGPMHEHGCCAVTNAFHPEELAPQLGDTADIACSGLWWSRNGKSLLVNYRGGNLYDFIDVDAIPACSSPKYNALPVGTPVAEEQLHVYKGRLNQETFAKECCMLNGDRYVATGCDEGFLHIWERASQRRVRRIPADRYVVNCVSPHPLGLPMLLTSGIDNDVKLWALGGQTHTMKDDAALVDKTDSIPNSLFASTLSSRLLRGNVACDILTADVSRERQKESEKLKNDAKDVFRDRGFSAAVSLYKRALSLLTFTCPDFIFEEMRNLRNARAILYNNIAACRFNLKDYSAAVVACTHSIHCDPTFVKAYLRRGKSLMELNNFEGAKDDLIKVKEMESESESRESADSLSAEASKLIVRCLKISEHRKKYAKKSQTQKNEKKSMTM